MADPIVFDRSCVCGGSSTQFKGKDQNGTVLVPDADGFWLIPDYGPQAAITADSKPDGTSPITIVFPDAGDDHRFEIHWTTHQDGRKLVAGTVGSPGDDIYEAPAETNLALNGAETAADTFGGIRVTPSGTANHSTSIAIDLSADNPPSIRIDETTQTVEHNPAWSPSLVFDDQAAVTAVDPETLPKGSLAVTDDGKFFVTAESGGTISWYPVTLGAAL